MELATLADKYVCIHITLYFTPYWKKNLRNWRQHKLSNFTDFVDSIAILSLRTQKEVHMLQILCEIWIECSLKHSQKNLPKINKIEAASDSVSRSGAVSRTGGWLYQLCDTGLETEKWELETGLWEMKVRNWNWPCDHLVSPDWLEVQCWSLD